MSTAIGIGRAVGPAQRKNTWVQTERSVHQAWAALISNAPMAARLAHLLVAHMGTDNAVVASQSTLGELLSKPGERPVHRHTVRKAVQYLERENWIEVLQIGGKGGALAYVVNDRVGWSRSRKSLRYSRFSAHVLVSESEQKQSIDQRTPLRNVNQLMRLEEQIPQDGDSGSR